MYYAYILAEHCWLILASLSYKPSVVKREDVETDWSASQYTSRFTGTVECGSISFVVSDSWIDVCWECFKSVTCLYLDLIYILVEFLFHTITWSVLGFRGCCFTYLFPLHVHVLCCVVSSDAKSIPRIWGCHISCNRASSSAHSSWWHLPDR